MTTTKEGLILSLGRGHNAFYCDESNFHLIGELRPRQPYKYPTLTEAVKTGIRCGVLIDTAGLLKPEDIKRGEDADLYVTSEDVRERIRGAAVVENREETSEDITKSIVMAEEDINDATLKVLTSFVEKNEELSFESLGLTSKPRIDELRSALKKHYGYTKE